MALVRTMRAELDAVGPAGPPLVRHARPSGQLPARAGAGPGRRRRRPRHGLRLPDRRRLVRRLDRPAGRPRVRPGGDRPGLHRARAGLARDPRRPVLRPGLVHRLRRRQRPHPDGRQVRVLRRGRLRDGRRARRGAWASLRRPGGLGLDGLPEGDLHPDLRLRDDLAPALLRRRGDARGALRPGQPGPAPRGRHLGPGVRRHAARALPRPRGQASSRTRPRRPRGSSPSRPPSTTRGSRCAGRPRTTGTASRATTSRSRRTGERGPPGSPARERRAPSTWAPTTTATRSGSAPATARATCPRGT